MNGKLINCLNVRVENRTIFHEILLLKVTKIKRVSLDMSTPELDLLDCLEPKTCRDENGFLSVKASKEAFFGESSTRGLDFRTLKETVSVGATKSQHFSQELYESRIASVQMFCAMIVIFHQIGKRVRDSCSLGWIEPIPLCI